VLPDVSEVGGWANFLRNHDEWNLLKLPYETLEHAREYFGDDDGASWIFGRGHRLRLANLLGGDHDRIAMAHALLLSYPGTPVVLSGDEIGMGSDLWLDERESVRTPMQWDDSKNGGFSTADPEDCYNPVIAHGEYGYQHVNAAAQLDDPDSLRARVKRAVGTRKATPEIPHGDLTLLESGHRDVAVHRIDAPEAALLFVHSFADGPRESVVGWDVAADRTERLLGAGDYHVADGGVTVQLGACDYVWLRGELGAGR
jgi:maltose alpha-D-glucosyltransferase/alpha-amylase